MARGMNRYTFVVQVHPEGISTLENLSTQERVQISDMAGLGSQIESWLAKLGEVDGDGGSGLQRHAKQGDAR